MSRAAIILTSPRQRETAHRWIDTAPPGTSVEFRHSTRTVDQNAALWSLLSQIQRQRPTHNGVKMTTDLWKTVMMQACGHETVFLPTLDGDGVFPMGHRSSKLTKAEMSELLEFILAWTAREGLTIEHFDGEKAA